MPRFAANLSLLYTELPFLDRFEAAASNDHAEVLQRLGFELTALGPSQIAVRAVPAMLADADPVQLARAVLAELADGDGRYLLGMAEELLRLKNKANKANSKEKLSLAIWAASASRWRSAARRSA